MGIFNKESQEETDQKVYNHYRERSINLLNNMGIDLNKYNEETQEKIIETQALMLREQELGNISGSQSQAEIYNLAYNDEILSTLKEIKEQLSSKEETKINKNDNEEEEDER